MTIKRKRKSARHRAGRKVRAATKRRATKRRATARKSNPSTGDTMARKRSTRRRRNPAAAPARRRRSAHRHRRNPPGFSPRMLVNTAVEGVVGGVEVVAGKAAVRLVRKQLGYAAGTTVAALIETVGAIAQGVIVSRFLGVEHGRRVMYGGMSAPIEQFVREAVKNSPQGTQLVHDALGDYGSYDTIIAYPDYEPAGYIGAGDRVGDAMVAQTSYPYQY